MYCSTLSLYSITDGHDTEAKTFAIKNSFGTGWGNNGYATVPFEYVDQWAFEMWTLKSPHACHRNKWYNAAMKVKVKNIQYSNSAWAFNQPEFFEYTGEEANLKHIKDSEIALTTGISEWPIRVIQKQWIVSIDNQPYTHFPQTTETETETKSKTAKLNKIQFRKEDDATLYTGEHTTGKSQWFVKGSKDQTYTVTKEHNKFTCTCSGFAFRKTCKHVTEIKNQLAAK